MENQVYVLSEGKLVDHENRSLSTKVVDKQTFDVPLPICYAGDGTPRFGNHLLMNWKPIPGLEGYEASDCGEIRRSDGVILAQEQSATGSGYLTVHAYLNGSLLVHNVSYLVAKAFLGPPPKGSDGIVVHGDGNRTNNRQSNLTWYAPDPKARKFYGFARGGQERMHNRATHALAKH